MGKRCAGVAPARPRSRACLGKALREASFLALILNYIQTNIHIPAFGFLALRTSALAALSLLVGGAYPSQPTQPRPQHADLSSHASPSSHTPNLSAHPPFLQPPSDAHRIPNRLLEQTSSRCPRDKPHNLDPPQTHPALAPRGPSNAHDLGWRARDIRPAQPHSAVPPAGPSAARRDRPCAAARAGSGSGAQGPVGRKGVFPGLGEHDGWRS